MNKYQESLDELRSLVHSELDGTRMLNEHLEYCDTLQELINQQSNPTLSECIKEWESRGWTWNKKYTFFVLKKFNQEQHYYDNLYIYRDEKKIQSDFTITFDLIPLIHKTLKAMEEMKDDNN